MVVIFFVRVLAVDASKFGPSAWGGSWTIFLQNWWSTVGRFKPTAQTFAWKKYWVQALIAILGNSRTEPRWWSKQHIISSLESLCRLQTTDEIKVNMPYRSPFITVETLCCLLVKLCPFYNNYSRLAAAIWSLLFWWQPMTFVWEIKDSVILVWSFYLQSSVQTR